MIRLTVVLALALSCASFRPFNEYDRQQAAEDAYRGDMSFCAAYPEVPICR